MRMIIAAAIAATLSGCGKDDSGSGSGTSALEGVWQGGCLDVGGGAFNRVTVKFEGDMSHETYLAYSESTCVISVAKFEDTSHFAIASSDSGVLKLDYTLEQYTATPLTDDAATGWNADPPTYGYNDWKNGETKDVSGRQFDANSKAEEAKGDRYFTVAKVDGDTLLFGDSDFGDGKSEAMRSTVFKTSYPLKKQ